MTTAVSDAISAPSAYQAALDFLFSRIDYERQTAVRYGPAEFHLDRMRDLLARLGSPHLGQQIVHIAGTKGKGSTAAMIAAILAASGRRTALYTSPHLERVEERLAVDGRPCAPEDLARLVEQVRPAVAAMDGEAAAAGRLKPTYFEITTAIALLYFARQQVDATVLEVGLGGRLDSTNVCQPLVSVITSISFDHMEQLGHTLAAIAGEKAGIIKPATPVVSGVTAAEPRDVIRSRATVCEAPLVELDCDFAFAYRPPRDLERSYALPAIDYARQAAPSWALAELEIGLVGRHQGANAAVAVTAVGELRRLGWDISDEAIRRGLAAVRCPARVEVLRWRPTVVVDAAHNVAAIEALAAALDESFAARRRMLVFATTRQKDYRGMLARLLGRFDEIVFTRYLGNPRAIPPEELAAAARELGAPSACVRQTPEEAWGAAIARADDDTLICVTGSFFIAAEIRQLLRE